MRIIKVVSLGALLAVPFGWGCGSSSNGNNIDGSVGHGGAGGAAGMDAAAGGSDGGTDSGEVGSDGGDGPAEAVEFTDFVKDLILNKTSPTTLPETLDDKTFKDSMSPAAFDGFFTP
jgi:hypothetical protein